VGEQAGVRAHAARTGSTFEISTRRYSYEVSFCTSRIARVRLLSGDHAEVPGYITRTADSWPGADLVTGGSDPLLVDTGSMTVRFVASPPCLEFAGHTGGVTLRVPLDDAEASDAVVDDRSLGTAAQLDEQLQGKKADRRSVLATLEPAGEQHFFGLGHGGKQFDRLGETRHFWNSHLGHGPGSDFGVPLLVSNRGYALFFDNASDALLIVGRTDGEPQLAYWGEGGRLDWYYLQGGDLKGVMAEAAELLGRAPLPPRWALGYLQSTRHFDDASEVLQLPRRMREKRIPCDAIIYLSTYGDALGWNRGVGHLEFQPDLFPDPAATLHEIRRQGFRAITHEYPVLHEHSPLYAEALHLGYLLSEGYDRVMPADRPHADFHEGQRFIDFSNPAARSWWWAQHRSLAEMGVEGWWLDGGEGPSATATLHEGTGSPVHNLYDRLRFQAFAGGEAADLPDRRPFLLCRSGAAGMQQYAAGCWSGDVNNTFATLEAQVPLGLNTGLSGIPYWGTDIGGFFHPIPESAELYARWFQFGAFCPIFRAHGWVWREHLPWAHGPEVEAICRRYAELRYRLLPYTYTLAWQAHTLGLPLMRPLVLGYPDDPRVWDLGSEYLWGDDLLVAPVTREGATAWPVYLPRGGWYDFWTQQHYAGPAGVTVDAPLDRLPLFVRAGSIVPLAPPAQYDGERPWDEITLLIHPEGRSRADIYEDDGHTNAYGQGHFALTPVTCEAQPTRITVCIGEPIGDRVMIPPNRTYVLQLMAGRPQRVLFEGTGYLDYRESGTEQSSCYWHDDRCFTYVRVEASRATISLEY
jgi:alpha-glucosidase